MNLVSRRQFLSFFLISTIAISGCASIGLLVSPIVTGVVYWVGAEAHKYYENEPDIIYRATKHVLTELDIPIKSEHFDKEHYKIVAGNLGIAKNRFEFDIERADKKITKLSIRIDYIGDKPLAELIYSKIDEQLNIIQFDP